MIVLPGRALAAMTAARRLHVPDAVRHRPSDGSASTASEVVSTVNSVGSAAPGAAAPVAGCAALARRTAASAAGMALTFMGEPLSARHVGVPGLGCCEACVLVRNARLVRRTWRGCAGAATPTEEQKVNRRSGRTGPRL
ncbi:hypothetical protein SVIOM74S_00070 [Streptomyces violarus]